MARRRIHRLAGAIVALAGGAVLVLAQFTLTPEEQKNQELVLNLYRDVLQYHHFELASK